MERGDTNMSVFTPEKQAQAKGLSLLLAQKVRDHFKSPENRAAFEAWYLKKFGKRYKWKSAN